MFQPLPFYLISCYSLTMLLREAEIRYRTTKHPVLSDRKIRSSGDIARLASEAGWYDGVPQERFIIIALDTKHRYLAHEIIGVGTVDSAIVHPRDVFRLAVLVNASAIVALHNHPSLDPTPSAEDRAVTRRLAKAAEIMGIDLLDSIVIGGDKHVSLRELGEIG